MGTSGDAAAHEPHRCHLSECHLPPVICNAHSFRVKELENSVFESEFLIWTFLSFQPLEKKFVVFNHNGLFCY